MGEQSRRSTITLFSDPGCHYSHRVRFVLEEKGVAFDIHECTPEFAPVELTDVNPYNSFPTLIDRDLVLYESTVMMEYLDERFPHPPLMPVYPVTRAQSRLWMHRIERDWGSVVNDIILDRPRVDKALLRRELAESLLGVAPAFGQFEFFMSDEFSLVDCCLAPLLWRLPLIGIRLPENRQAKPLLEYMKRIFARPGFQRSLSGLEKDIPLRG